MVIMGFFFRQKTAYEMRISDWSSDVGSSDLATEWLAQRLEGLRSQVRDSERAAELFRSTPGLQSSAGTKINEQQLSELHAQLILARATDRKSAVWGMSVSVRVDRGGRRIVKKKYRTISMILFI